MPALKREGLGEKLNVDVTGDDWQFTLIAFIAFAQYLESFVNIWPRHSSALEYWKCNSFNQVHNSPSPIDINEKISWRKNNFWKGTQNWVEDWLSPAAGTLSRFYSPRVEINSHSPTEQ